MNASKTTVREPTSASGPSQERAIRKSYFVPKGPHLCQSPGTRGSYWQAGGPDAPARRNLPIRLERSDTQKQTKSRCPWATGEALPLLPLQILRTRRPAQPAFIPVVAQDELQAS